MPGVLLGGAAGDDVLRFSGASTATGLTLKDEAPTLNPRP